MGVKTISGPQRKFCEEVVRGRPHGEAYQIAYPDASPAAAATAGPRLFKNVQIQECIAELRDKADNRPGSAVLTRAEKRDFLARLVRCQIANLPPDSDLIVSIKQVGKKQTGQDTSEDIIEYKVPDKLAAIKLDNDLGGEGSEAESQDALTELIGRITQ